MKNIYFEKKIVENKDNPKVAFVNVLLKQFYVIFNLTFS